MAGERPVYHFRYQRGTKGGATFAVPKEKGLSRDEALIRYWCQHEDTAGTCARLRQLILDRNSRKAMTAEDARRLMIGLDVMDRTRTCFVMPQQRALAAYLMMRDPADCAAIYYDCCQVLGIDPAEGRYEPAPAPV